MIAPEIANIRRISALVIAAALSACSSKPPDHPILEQQVQRPDVANAPAADTMSSDGATADTPALDRTKRPTPRPIAELVLPKAEQFTLPNGLEVNLITTTTLPIVTMTFEFDVGTASDPPDKVGLASACFDLYSEGTQRLDKVAWSEALADHAIDLSTPAGADNSTIVMESLTSELGPALDLLAELIRTPGMRKADFDRIIAGRKAALAQSRGTVAGIAGHVFPSLTWGREHPYGVVPLESHLDAVKLDDCKAWVAQLKPDGARLWVAGKVKRDELTQALTTRLADWTGKAPTAREVPPAPAPDGTIYAVQLDGAVQSTVMVGHPGPLRTADDYEATFLMAQIFGGGFSSRLNMNLREAKGYAYGSSGRFSYRRVGSQMTITAPVEATTTALALREMSNEIQKMRAGPPTAAELSRERDGALLALPARFANPADTLDELRTLRFFGLPADWFAAYQTRLKAVDAAAVAAAATAHLMPGNAVVLVVGDLTRPAKDAPSKTVRDELQALADTHPFGPGGLVIIDADGIPKK